MTSAHSTSKLQKSVQDLICMLFDVEAMKRTLIEFELDLTKMPLGKLSKKQLEKAYGILSQAQELLDSKAVSKTKLVDVSNQFYTLIPHDFGRKTPPVLDNCEIIKVIRSSCMDKVFTEHAESYRRNFCQVQTRHA